MTTNHNEEIFRAVENYLRKNYKPRRRHFLPERKSVLAGAKPALRNILDLLLKNVGKTFSEKLMSLIAESGKKPSEIYLRAGITKQHFSKIKNNPHYQPTKETALAFAVALELDLDETNDLIKRAGFALSPSSYSDLIVEYFIKEKIYDIDELNYNLYARDLEPLTNNRNAPSE